MRIMAIRARHQPFVHAMVLGLREIRFDIPMTAIAQSGLSRDQQIMPRGSSVNGMACRAANTIRQVRRAHEIRMTFALLMTGRTAFARLSRAQSRKADNFRRIAS